MYFKSNAHRFNAYYYTIIHDDSTDPIYSEKLTWTYDYSTWVDYTTGEKLPDWRTRVRTHSNATTPFEGYLVTRRFTKSFVTTYYKDSNGIDRGGYRSVHGAVGNTTKLNRFVPPDPMPASVTNAALAGFYRKIRNNRTAVSGGVVLGELAETLRGIRHPARALRRGISDYLNDSKKIIKASKNQRAALSAMSGSWLEYVFGWAPLINDVRSGMTYLDRKAEKLVNDYKDISFSAREETLPWNVVNEDVPGQIAYVYGQERITEKDMFQVRIRGQVRHKVSPQTGPDWSLLGLDPWADFLPTVWELIPYSFVVDYFTNIGDVIDSYSIGLTDLAWYSYTERRTRRRRYEYHPSPKKAQEMLGSRFISQLSGGPCVMETDVKYTNRYGTDKLKPPSFRFEIPGLGNKWINIGALTIQHGLSHGAFLRLKR